MELHFTADDRRSLSRWAQDTGRRSDELVDDAAMACSISWPTRGKCSIDVKTIWSRVQSIDGEEAYCRLTEKTESQPHQV
jgi:hypothetical protein